MSTLLLICCRPDSFHLPPSFNLSPPFMLTAAFWLKCLYQVTFVCANYTTTVDQINVDNALWPSVWCEHRLYSKFLCLYFVINYCFVLMMNLCVYTYSVQKFRTSDLNQLFVSIYWNVCGLEFHFFVF